MDVQEIIVVGYPRSGNSWLARLLGDILSCPIQGARGAVPLSQEGQDRTGSGFVVLQLHLAPTYDKNSTAIPSPYIFSVPAWTGQKVIHILRDPRDVTVSVLHYWERPGIRDAIRIVGEGLYPMFDSWQNYVSKWLQVANRTDTGGRLTFAWYCKMFPDPLPQVKKILSALQIEIPADGRIRAAIERQRFENRVRYVEQHGERMPYGIGIQRKSLRKGIPKDYANFYGEEESQMARGYFGEVAEMIGYKL